MGEIPMPKSALDTFFFNTEFAPDNRFYYFNKGNFAWKGLPGVGTGQRPGDESGWATVDDLIDWHADGKTFFYASAEYREVDAQTTALVEGFLPMKQEVYAQPGVSKSKISEKGQELRFWIASDGATATTHYDIQHNFFCQITGSKSFRLAPATSHNIIAPYTLSHPRYRQGVEPKVPVVNPKCASTMEEALSKSCPNANVSAHIQSFPVSLHSGDCIFMPAYMFHEVQNVKDAISINWW